MVENGPSKKAHSEVYDTRDVFARYFSWFLGGPLVAFPWPSSA